MSWWNKNKKIILFIFTGLLFLVGVTVVLLMVLGPIVGCTFVGCRGGIQVELDGLPVAMPYQVILSSPSGEISTISCDPGAEDNLNSFEKSCLSNGAYFSLEPDALPSDEITVTVLVGESKVSQAFQPDYKKFQPNGENCDPVCYSAIIRMNMSQ
jgi:hypothetical protein